MGNQILQIFIQSIQELLLLLTILLTDLHGFFAVECLLIPPQLPMELKQETLTFMVGTTTNGGQAFLVVGQM